MTQEDVFNTNTPDAPQNYDEIEAVLAILHGSPEGTPIGPIRRRCYRRLQDMRTEKLGPVAQTEEASPLKGGS